MPNQRQKDAFKIHVEEGLPVSKAMIKARYSPATARKPYQLTRSKAWQEMIAELDDRPVLEGVIRTALDRKDKRAHLQAADMVFKLKDRYPAGKLKITAYKEELDKVSVDN